jgi:hypothetical protein
MEIEDNLNILVYPNPVTEGLLIQFKGNKYGHYGIEMFDVAGKMLHHSEEHIKDEYVRKSLDMSGFSKGLYLIKIIHFDENINMFYRIMKQ